MAQQTATTAVGLELGSDDGLDGTIGFDGMRSRDVGVGDGDDSFSSRAGWRRAIAMATKRVSRCVPPAFGRAGSLASWPRDRDARDRGGSIWPGLWGGLPACLRVSSRCAREMRALIPEKRRTSELTAGNGVDLVSGAGGGR